WSPRLAHFGLRRDIGLVFVALAARAGELCAADAAWLHPPFGPTTAFIGGRLPIVAGRTLRRVIQRSEAFVDTTYCGLICSAVSGPEPRSRQQRRTGFQPVFFTSPTFNHTQFRPLFEFCLAIAFSLLQKWKALGDEYLF